MYTKTLGSMSPKSSGGEWAPLVLEVVIMSLSNQYPIHGFDNVTGEL
jgi:hypothetical protein